MSTTFITPGDRVTEFLNGLQPSETPEPAAAPAAATPAAAEPVADPATPPAAAATPPAEPSSEAANSEEVTEESLQAVAAEEGEPEPSKSKQVWAAYKSLAELEKPPQEGGLGHVPTPEQIKTYFDHSQTLNGLLAAAFSGDPADLDKFFYELDQMNPGAERTIYQNIPKVLKRLDGWERPGSPYHAMRQDFLKDLMKETFDKAKLVEDEGQKKAWDQLGSLFYHLLYGKKYDPQVGLEPPEDPEVKRLREENQALQKRSFEAQVKAMSGHYVQSVQTYALTAADKALASLKASFPSDELFKATAKTVAQTAIREAQKNEYLVQTITASNQRVAGFIRAGQLEEASKLIEQNIKFTQSSLSRYIQAAVSSLGVKPKPAAKPAATAPAAPAAAAATPAAPAAPAAAKPATGPMTAADIVRNYLAQQGIGTGV